LGNLNAAEIGVNMTAPEKRRDRMERWVRVVRARPRLFSAILLGLAVVMFLPATEKPQGAAA
jgi:hypothetical protein